MRDRRVRHDAMTEIEDEPTRGKLSQDTVDRPVEPFAAGMKHRRIEVPLHGDEGLQPAPHHVKGHGPVDRNPVDAGLADIAFETELDALWKTDDAGIAYRTPHQGYDPRGRADRPSFEFLGT